MPYSDVHIWRLERAGQFPHRVQLGPRSVAWYEDEIEAWCADAPLYLVTLRAVEPIYTARPIIEGSPDPVPQRIALLPGLADVSIQKLADLTPAAWAARNR